MPQMVSVIMAVYNGGRFLEEAIESVLCQTFADFELVIIDDGSTDQSSEIVARYAARDSRILFVRQTNCGLPASLNRAIKTSRYDLLARMDADDRMLPNRLERQLDFIAQNPGIAVACSYSYLINTSGKRIGKSENPVDVNAGRAELNPERFLQIVHPTVMMRKQDVLGVGGYSQFSYAEDRDLWGRIVTAGKMIKCQPELLMEYRLHSATMTMRKVFGNDMTVRSIDINILRRLQGKPELSLDEIKAEYYKRTLWERLNERRRFSATRLYKNATRYYSEQKLVQFATYFTMALILAPIFSLRRAMARLT